jgi:hypothetical protein
VATVIYRHWDAAPGEPLIPTHCKVVGKLRLPGPLTRESILAASKGRLAYKLTDFYCVTDGSAWAVASIRKAAGRSLLVPIRDVRVIAGPEETAYVEDPTVDTTNPSSMLMAAERHAPGARCVVVQGEFNHLSFVVRGGHEVRVTALDVVPPRPSKVAELARRALATTGLPVILSEEVVDLADFAREVPADRRLMMPCRASGLAVDRPVDYLDEQPPLGGEEPVTLVGCRLSGRIFRERYGRDPDRTVTMCPLELASLRGVQGWTLVKCCNEKGPYTLRGDVVAVPWSATRGDVAAALDEVVTRDRIGKGITEDALLHDM